MKEKSEGGIKVKDFVQAIQAWMAKLPPGTAEITEKPVPDDDEYGLVSILALKPVKASACPIELGFVGPEHGSGVYIFLDNWARVAQLAGLPVPTGTKSKLIGMYVEPITLSIEQVLDICQSVASGAVYLTVGVVGGRLGYSAGYTLVAGKRFNMRGNGAYPLSFVRLISLFGWGNVQELQYPPWV